MTTTIPISYKKAWTNAYILIGLICVLIFLIGFFVIGDYMNLIYSLASIVPIYLGVKMKKTPYAIVSKTKIEVFGLFGELRHVYSSEDDALFVSIKNKIWLKKNKQLQKVKMNKWFVNQQDWNAVLELFK